MPRGGARRVRGGTSQHPTAAVASGVGLIVQLRVDTIELVGSDVVGAWTEPIRAFICPGGPVPPAPCDCGFRGLWESRPVYVWRPEPGCHRTDATIRRDLACGLPARAGDQGWWVIVGRDERCPGCGDTERFDLAGELVDRRRDHADVVMLSDALAATNQLPGRRT